MHICTAVEMFYLEKSDCFGLYKKLEISDSSGLCLGVVNVGAWRVCVFGGCVRVWFV